MLLSYNCSPLCLAEERREGTMFAYSYVCLACFPLLSVKVITILIQVCSSSIELASFIMKLK